MNSREILQALDSIGVAKGVKAKKDLLGEFLLDKEFSQAIWWALNPYITFGVGKKSLEAKDMQPDPSDGVFLMTEGKTVVMLDELSRRQLTGQAALNKICGILCELDHQSQDLLRRILLKDLGVGVGASTINQVRKNFLPQFRVMLAAKLEDRYLTFPTRVEPKYDGMRVIAMNEPNGDWTFVTRKGLPVATISETMCNDLARLAANSETDQQLVFDGELIGKNFRDTMRKARRKSVTFNDALFMVFDCMTRKEFTDGCKASYGGRRRLLEKMFSETACTCVHLPPSYWVGSETELWAVYGKARDDGLEGLIVKSPTGLYHPRRNRAWMKMKDKLTADVPIVDAVEGTGKYVGQLGAWVVDFEGVKVNVGSGITDIEREEYWFLWQHDRGQIEDRLIQVSYHEKTPDGSMRHPRFDCFRDDKPAIEGVGV